MSIHHDPWRKTGRIWRSSRELLSSLPMNLSPSFLFDRVSKNKSFIYLYSLSLSCFYLFFFCSIYRSMYLSLYVSSSFRAHFRKGPVRRNARIASHLCRIRVRLLARALTFNHVDAYAEWKDEKGVLRAREFRTRDRPLFDSSHRRKYERICNVLESRDYRYEYLNVL